MTVIGGYAANLDLAFDWHLCPDFILVGDVYHGLNGEPKAHHECWLASHQDPPPREGLDHHA
jgi:hypothetical protein